MRRKREHGHKLGQKVSSSGSSHSTIPATLPSNLNTYGTKAVYNPVYAQETRDSARETSRGELPKSWRGVRAPLLFALTYPHETSVTHIDETPVCVLKRALRLRKPPLLIETRPHALRLNQATADRSLRLRAHPLELRTAPTILILRLENGVELSTLSSRRLGEGYR